MTLIERDGQLAQLRRMLDGVHSGGHVALVGAEAGAGKTSLLRALAAGHAGAGGTVWWGACDALGTPHPLAPLLDIARDAAPRWAAQLAGPRPALFDAVLAALQGAPRAMLMVVEDAHWADEATLDLLQFVGRRIERTRALLVVSYRDDEVGATHPLRRVFGELPAGARSVVPVHRLSETAVRTLAQRHGRDPDGVFEATQGNAFFVTELLRDGLVPPALPGSVRDLVLARYARLPTRAQAVLNAVAVVPGRAETALIEALVAPALPDLEAALASGLLQAEDDRLAYRHELGRVAVESALSAPAARQLHAQVLAWLEDPARGAAPARLMHHAVRAQDRLAVGRHGPRAAAEALARVATREAVAQWEATLRLALPADAAQEESWLEAALAAFARAGRDHGRDALCARLEALARQRGDLARAAGAIAQRAMASVARNAHAQALAANAEALALVEPLPASPAKVAVWRTEAWLRMLDRDCEPSLAWATRTLPMAEALGLDTDRDALRHLVACNRLLMGDARGFDDLRALADRHRAAGLAPLAVTCLSNLGSGAGEVMRLDVAEPALREAVALARSLEMDGHVDYAGAWLALCRLHQGDWHEAGTWAQAVCERPGVTGMSRLMALLALGRLRARRGDPGADAALDEALSLAGTPGTLQRVAPVRAARAELAFARGDLAAVRAEVAAALPLARAKRHPWFIGELAFWGWRAGDASTPAEGAAGPWALQMAGHWREAAAAWAALGCPYEQARALADGDADAQREALTRAEALGAQPLAEPLRRRLQRQGVRGLPRGPRAATQAHPAGLTAAEQRVLQLLGQGLRNAEIAGRLHRSVRTIDHQVAAVLAKLGAPSRAEAVQRARREGWLDAAT